MLRKERNGVTTTTTHDVVCVEYDAVQEYTDPEEHQLKLFPNPAQAGELLHIEGISVDTLYSLYSSSGVLLYSGTVHNQTLRLSATLAQGMYILQIQGKTQKLAISN